MIGTARANPGARVQAPEHYEDPERVAPLRTVYEALTSLDVDALGSIGGDDTLKTANKFAQFQQTLPAAAQMMTLPTPLQIHPAMIRYLF